MEAQKITIKKHFKHIWPYIVFLLIMLVIIFYDWANPVNNNRAIYIIYVVLIVVSILNIYLHFEYYFTNRGIKIFHDKENNILIYSRKGKEETILPSKIMKVEIYQSRFYKKKGGFLTTDNYRFYKFILEGNRIIIITSLLYPNFEYNIEKRTEIIEKTIASIFHIG